MAEAEVELQQIGTYPISSLLSASSTHSLYMGKQRKKDVVIKVVHAPLSTDEAKEAFLAHVRQLKKLKHRHIIDILDYGLTTLLAAGNEQGFLVMQYVPGETLLQRTPPGASSPADEVRRRLSLLATALHYAHVSNIIHGNLHPGNLLVTASNDILLTDFSLPVGAWTPGHALPYMAPEHLRGSPSAASDQYALAVMVYAWLCGRRPYASVERAQLMRQQEHEALPRPASLNSAISPAVESVLLRALAYDPSGRFQHIQTFADNYLRALMGQPIDLETRRSSPPVPPVPPEAHMLGEPEKSTSDTLHKAPIAAASQLEQQLSVDAIDWEPATRPARKGASLLHDAVVSDLCQGGILSQSLPGYEERPAQIEMAALVAQALNQNEHALVEASTGTGKALDVDTAIPTPVGWKRMGDLAIGDFVFDELGQPARVTAAFDVMHDRRCYEVVFSDGSSLVADGEHEWASYTASDRKWASPPKTAVYASKNFVRVGQLTMLDQLIALSQNEDALAIGGALALVGGHQWGVLQAARKLAPINLNKRPARYRRLARNLAEQPGDGRAYTLVTTEKMAATLTVSSTPRANHAIAVAGPLVLPDADLPIAPYFLGVWLGEGARGNNQITTADPGLINRHIPAIYLRASEQQRRALLAGLLDTDGTVSHTGAIELATISPQLAQDAYELVCSLGYRPALRCGRARCKGKDCGPTWTLAFTTEEQVFRLPRKANAQKERPRDYSSEGNRFRYVVAVHEVPTRPVRCIQVDSQSHLYLAGRSMIPTHNSLAYLLPIVRSGKVAIISTANKALQEQLFYKDIPFVQQHIKHFEAALVKGVGNYLCIDRMESERTGMQFYAKNRDFMRLLDITNDAGTAFTGDFETLDFQLPADIRSKVCVDSDQCAWSKCNWFGDCYVHKMRLTAERAQVIVVNHTLLLLDAALDGFLLPERDVIVLDEAHHLEEEATRAFTITISPNSITTLLAQHLLKNHSQLSLQDEANRQLGLTWQRLQQVADPGYKGRANLQAPLEEGLKLATAIGDLADSLRKQRPKDLPEKEGQLYDKLLKRTQNLADNIRIVFAADQPGKFVYYVERSASSGTRGYQLQVSAAPLDITSWLKERLFNQCHVICTSATLATIGPNPAAPELKGPNFAYFRRRTGLDPLEAPGVIERILPLTFDYASKALLYLPRHLPAPVYGQGSDDYALAIAREMYSLVKRSEGRAFLLFSSKRMLDQAYELMSPHLDYPLLRQGDMSRLELTRRFRAEKGAILFGLKSFWEGVDISGEALSMVVIDKLPFDPPDDPVHEARVAQMKAAGENWFGIYVLPQAVLRLKQGLGRLLRSREDRGIMAILDTRLHSKGYGKMVLDALPPARRTSSIRDVERFFDEEEERQY